MKLVIGVLLPLAILVTFFVGTMSEELYANTSTADNTPIKINDTTVRIPEYIDGIEIPGSVIVYVHTKYQGHAITQAIKTTRDGQPVYILRVSSDSNSTYENSLFLLYDNSWNLIGDETIQPAPPTTVSIPDNETTTTQDGLPANIEPPTPTYNNNSPTAADSTPSAASDTTESVGSEEDLDEDINGQPTEADTENTARVPNTP
jgi:hypothetical protein